MNLSLEKTVKEWAKEWRTENLSPETQRLITLASFDLYFGPIGDVDDDGNPWPGFQKACEIIREAVEDVPSVLFVDDGAGYWQESEPESERCEECKGVGCETCNKQGYFDPPWEDFYKLGRKELRELIVGKELAKYL
jgi:hypothetical protein